MQKFSGKDILRATKGELLCGNDDFSVKRVVTDSRIVQSGDLFVPFCGETFDGHDYIDNVLQNGAAAALSEKDIKSENGAVIKVKSTLDALGAIAAEYLRLYPIPVVGITGSVGKTSTKDMISAVLARKFDILKSTGNHNNEIGMPLTILEKEENHNMAVLEMGMSAFGELDYLANIARPAVAVITNIGMSHIENLGSQEGILKAKLEICNYFNGGNILFANGDDKFLKDIKKDFPIIRYGLGEHCDVRAEDIKNNGILGSDFTLFMDGKKYPAEVKAPGMHNVYNALAAIAVGVHYGISPEECIKGVAAAEMTDMRMSIEKSGENVILKDFYNAAPDSIRASLEVLKTVEGHRRVAVLGDVLEMGSFAEEEHRKLGKSVNAAADILITAGENAKFIAEGAKDAGMSEVISFDDTDAAAENIKNIVKDGDCILIKASRGMKFEKIYQKIK